MLATLSKEKYFPELVKMVKEQPRVLLFMRSQLAGIVGDDRLFKQAVANTKKKNRELVKAVYQIQVLATAASHSFCHPLPFACSEVRMLLQGQDCRLPENNCGVPIARQQVLPLAVGAKRPSSGDLPRNSSSACAWIRRLACRCSQPASKT